MRSALFIAAGFAIATSGPALAASQPAAAPATSTTPDTSSSAAPAGGSAADTSATAAGPTLSVGEPVRDNTGATIGAISSINTNVNGQQMAVIKMGNDTFQVSSDKLGAGDGSVTINLSATQIGAMIHPAAGGR
jgi:hypothetical protein